MLIGRGNSIGLDLLLVLLFTHSKFHDSRSEFYKTMTANNSFLKKVHLFCLYTTFWCSYIEYNWEVVLSWCTTSITHSCNQVLAKMWIFSKKDVWGQISGLNAVHLASLSARLCPLLQLSHKPPPSCCQHRSSLQGFKPRARQTKRYNTCTHVRARFLTTSHAWNLGTHPICAVILAIFFSFCSSITHTQTHTGIRAFYRASVGWCGRHYGSTAPPSID